MRQSLLDTVELLNQQLNAAENLDHDQLAELRRTLAELQERLDDMEDKHGGLVTKLSEMATQIESSHPQITNTIGRLADLLSQFGI